MSEILARPVTDEDVPALARMDLAYDASRVLVVAREGDGAEVTLRLSWRDGWPQTAVYNEYAEDRLRGAMQRADLFLVAESGGLAVGLLMVLLPAWTNAGEITDLAIGRASRRSGAGRALVEAAVAWARERGLRALWVEPRSDNAAAIEFYLRLGFRISGFNDRMYSNMDDDDGRVTLYMYRELLDAP